MLTPGSAAAPGAAAPGLPSPDDVESVELVSPCADNAQILVISRTAETMQCKRPGMAPAEGNRTVVTTLSLAC